MKLLINALHTTTGGGVVYLNHILPGLARQPWEVVLLCPEASREQINVPENVEVKTTPGRGFVATHLWEQFVLPILCRWWGVRVTLCNANYVPLFAPRPIPIIHTNPAVARFTKGLGWWLYWQSLKLLTRLSMWRAREVLSVAEHVIEAYASGPWRFLKPKVRVASPACDIGEEQGRLEPDGDLVLAIGDVYVQKNYPLLIKAFALLHKERPTARLMIIGRVIQEDEYEKMTALVAEHNLEDAVTLPKPLPHAQVLQILQQAAVLVSASLVETFNIPVLEALACRTPVVIGDFDFQREIVGNSGAYVKLNDGGDVLSALAVAIYMLLEYPHLSEQLIESGRSRAEKFTWTGSVKVIKGVVEKAYL
jgi:glycosyltransferase involved in cell wall biosynthesis